MTLPAISLHAPYGTAIAEGFKQWETRGYRPPDRYIGQRVAIHQALKAPEEYQQVDYIAGGDTGWRCMKLDSGIRRNIPWWVLERMEDGEGAGLHTAVDLPLGVIVATAVIGRVVPCVAAPEYGYDGTLVRPCIVEHPSTEAITLYTHGAEWGYAHCATDLGDQAMWGNYQPGRWAWEMLDVRPLVEPIPAKGRQGWWRVTPEADDEIARAHRPALTVIAGGA